MATKTATARLAKKDTSTTFYQWVGKDRRGRVVKGETSARGEAAASAQLRRQGISVTKIRKLRKSQGRKIKTADITLFTRQLSTMMKAGIPLIQSFDISAQGHPNANMARLLESIRKDIESGSSMASAFRKHPMYFNDLYCNLIEAGEAGGILENLLDRLATYLEKTESMRRKVRGALIYPAAVIVVVIIVIAIMMIFVIPTFKDVFSNMGATLPGVTLAVMNISDFVVAYWWIILIAIVGSVYFIKQTHKRSADFRAKIDTYMLSMPIFGNLVTKSVIARWTRTLATMFAAGVPLVDSLTAVAGAAGNSVYAKATNKIRQDVTAGTSLTIAMGSTALFPTMVTQMTGIGEESGSLDEMLNNVADFYEAEVDEIVKGISALIEPIVICVIAVVIGFIMVAMYLPIFQLGNIV
ncbi:MAG: type II secretion system F family protein [Saezia sp.]